MDNRMDLNVSELKLTVNGDFAGDLRSAGLLRRPGTARGEHHVSFHSAGQQRGLQVREVGAIKTLRTTLAIRTAGTILLLTWSAAAQQQTIKIWPGAAPGSENWTEPETVMKGNDTDRVANVVTPTLIAYLPEKSKATGPASSLRPAAGSLISRSTKRATWSRSGFRNGASPASY
jgi:hypothetical protein